MNDENVNVICLNEKELWKSESNFQKSEGSIIWSYHHISQQIISIIIIYFVKQIYETILKTTGENNLILKVKVRLEYKPVYKNSSTHKLSHDFGKLPETLLLIY